MTEQEWLASTNPAAMLDVVTRWGRFDHLRRISVAAGWQPDFIASDRELRLFACACCRQVWDGCPCPRSCYTTTADYIAAPRSFRNDEGLEYACDCDAGRVGGLTDPRSRRAVEVAERYADGQATKAELRRAHLYLSQESPHEPAWALAYAACELPEATNPHNIRGVRDSLIPISVQAALLRDIFAPFAKDVRHCPSCGPGGWEHVKGRCCPHSPLAKWLRWNDGTVPRIAEAIYDGSIGWQHHLILHDALLDAGCDDEGILEHCRGKGPHVRGCWVIDLMLGKK